ncbi:XRE family transcriptional regulator [Chitinophagaceae bacterium MMS25-I14]
MKSQNFFWAGNLKFLRNRRKLSQDELSETLNITRVKLSAHENGHTKNPTAEDLVRFSEYYKMSIDNLLKVDLSKLSELKLRELEAGNDTYATGTKMRVLATTVDKDDNENVELVSVKAKAGYTAGYGDPDFIAQLPVFHLPHLPKDRKYRMFPTTGDSMLPVPENAFVIGEYLEDWMSLKNGTPCIVVTKNDGIVFKLVTAQPGEKTLHLESLNTHYKPYNVSIGDVLEVWRFRNYVADALPEPEQPIQEIARMIQEMQADVKKLVKR